MVRKTLIVLITLILSSLTSFSAENEQLNNDLLQEAQVTEINNANTIENINSEQNNTSSKSLQTTDNKATPATKIDKTTINNSPLQKIQIEENAILSIVDCVNIALSNSPNIKKFKYNYNLAKNNVNIAKADYFPQFSVGTNLYYQGNKQSSRSSYNSQYHGVEASLRQLIWNFGKTSANIKMKKFNTIAALYNFNNSVLDTIYNVKTNYYGVLAAKAALDINTAYVKINERNYQRTTAYYEEGLKSKIDMVNAEVNLSDAKVQLVQAQNRYKNMLVTLNNSMFVAYAPQYEIQNTETFNFKHNYTPVSLTEISERPDYSILPDEVSDALLVSQVEKAEILEDYKFEPFPYSFEESLEIAKKNRPDLKSFEATINAMKESLKYTQRQYYPELTGGVGYNLRNTTDYINNGFNVSVGLTSTLNMMSVKNEIENAKIQVGIAENELELAQQNIYFEVQNAYINMVELEKQIPLMAVKVRQTLENFELADGRYEVGLDDYITLQDAKVAYNNAQQNYVEAIYNYNVARAKLELAIALPDENNILNIEEWYGY